MTRVTACHRVVTRNAAGKITADIPAEHFAAAEPIWKQAVADAPDGHTVTLQHGARIIKDSAQ